MDLKMQYALVTSSREALFGYCRMIAAADFILEHSSFGRGSIRNLLVHNANTYQFWIGKNGLQRDMIYPEYDSVTTITEARQLFSVVDALVHEFLEYFAGNETQEISILKNGKPATTTPLQLFTHVITHEFHHKGQILSLSRHLGYIPIDTDVIR